jgi:arabinan endo-1,5-alpha-L-arabinosidase
MSLGAERNPGLFLPNIEILKEQTEYTNPVFSRNTADPVVIRDPFGRPVRNSDGNFVIASTQSFFPETGWINIPSAVSPDMVHWEAGPDLMPLRAPWSRSNRLWAPDVMKLGERFIMAFNDLSKHNGHAIGLAFSEEMMGPYIPRGGYLDVDKGFSVIDSFLDFDPITGEVTIYYGSHHKPIRAAKLDLDNVSILDGSKVEVLGIRDENLLRLVEASWLKRRVKPDGTVVNYLFVSGDNAFGYESYGISAARSYEGPTSGFEYMGTVLKGTDPTSEKWLFNPGHHSMFVDDEGQDWIAYHAYDMDQVLAQIKSTREEVVEASRRNDERSRKVMRSLRIALENKAPRQLCIDPIYFDDEKDMPYVKDGVPSITPQKGPVFNK